MFRSAIHRIAWCLIASVAWMSSVPVVSASTGAGTDESLVVDGVAFPRSYAGEGVSLRLHNAALLRYKVFFRGYVVGLYLPDGADPTAALGDVPKRLEFHYFWDIPGAEFGKAGERDLARNVDGPTMKALRDRLDRIDRAYRDVKLFSLVLHNQTIQEERGDVGKYYKDQQSETSGQSSQLNNYQRGAKREVWR